MKILILCLRRSGSTEFWKAFRQDERLLCFDEPFNPMLKDLPKVFLKRTNLEFIDLYKKDKKFFGFYSPIDTFEELGALKKEQLSYLNYLFEQSENVVIDSTRLNFKVDELVDQLSDDIFIIHLYRDPIAFASSHILANRSELKGWPRIKSKIKYRFNQFFFWKVKKGYNDWGYENLANILGLSKRKCAYYNLIKVWFESFERIERSLSKRPNSMSISFEEFTKKPESIFKEIYLRNYFSYEGLDFSNLRDANLGYDVSNVNWSSVLEEVKTYE